MSVKEARAMAAPTLTLQLPDPLYARLEERARRANRSVEDELLDTLAVAVPDDPANAVADLHLLDDAALWQAARGRLAAAALERLGELNDLRQRAGLSAAEAAEAAALTRQYEQAVLVRARAAALLRARGHDVSGLVGP
jgi:hypothetical protein